MISQSIVPPEDTEKIFRLLNRSDWEYHRENTLTGGFIRSYIINNDITVVISRSSVPVSFPLDELHIKPIVSLFFQIEGQSRFTEIAKDGVSVEKGQGLICSLKEYNRLYIPSQNDYYFLSLLIDPFYFHKLAIDLNQNIKLINSLADEQIPSSRIVHQSILGREINMILHQLIQCPLHDQYKKLYFEGKILELLAVYFQRISEASNPSIDIYLSKKDRENLYSAKDYLDKHLENPPSIQALSGIAGINDFKLKRGFKKLFGSTIYSYIRQMRMEKAKALLMEGYGNVTEVSLSVGYKNPSRFSKAFKETYGANPRTFLK